jgi:hypothetical protein
MNCIDCEESVRFYEECLLSEKVDGKVKDNILRSFLRLFGIFSEQLKGTLQRLIPKQRFLTKAQLLQWLNAIEKHPSIEAVKALSLLFPIEIELGIEIMGTLSEIATHSEDLRDLVIQEICSVMTRQISKSDITFYVLHCQNLFVNSESSNLVRHVLESDFEISEKIALAYFDVLEVIDQVHKVPIKAKEKLIGSLPKVDPQAQKKFIHGMRNEIDLLLTVWQTYLDHNSPSFDKGLWDSCSSIILPLLLIYLRSNSERNILLVLDFIRTSQAPPKRIARVNSLKWHVSGSIPFILPFLSSSNPTISRSAKSAVRSIQLELKDIISETSAEQKQQISK